MLGFFKDNKPSLILIVVLFLAAIAIFGLNYIFYLKFDNESSEEKIITEEKEEIKNDYGKIEETLTAPENGSKEISDELLKNISSSSNNSKASEEVLNSLTAPK